MSKDELKSAELELEAKVLFLRGFIKKLGEINTDLKVPDQNDISLIQKEVAEKIREKNKGFKVIFE